MAAAAH